MKDMEMCGWLMKPLSSHGKKPSKWCFFLSGKHFWMNRRIWGFPKLANITSTVVNIHWLTCRKMQKHKIDLGMFKYLVNTWLNIWLIPMTWVFLLIWYATKDHRLSGGWCSILFMFSLFETGIPNDEHIQALETTIQIWWNLPDGFGCR